MVVASVAETPVTTPVADTVAIAELLLLQTLPGVPVVLVKDLAEPEHTLSAPAITPATGNGFTVTIKVAVADPQLKVVAVYDIIAVVIVVALPITTPVADDTFAASGLLLVHVPPKVDSASVIEDPEHTLDGPEIMPASGSGFTVTK